MMKKLLCMTAIVCLFLSACTKPAITTDTPQTLASLPQAGTQVFSEPPSSATTTTESVTTPPDTQLGDSPINIDPRKVTVTDVLPEDMPFLPFLSPAHLDESWSVVRVLHYPGKSLGYQCDLEWVWAAYYPNFNDLKSLGADAIRKYYVDQYEHAISEAQSYTFDDELPNDISSSTQYSFSDWNSYTVGNYLVVTRYTSYFYGGIHPVGISSAEQFDLLTGNLLTNEDVFGDLQTAAPIINAAITKHLVQGDVWPWNSSPESIDILSKYTPLSFRLAPDGIVFIFNEYEPGPNSEVLVPYGELRPILKLDPASLGLS